MANPYLRAQEEGAVEEQLRPATFDEFVGQRRVVDNLRIAAQAARERGEAMDHILLSGLPGTGKTTLAGIVAAEIQGKLTVTAGPVLKRPADLVGLLTRLKARDVLFIDEIHRISAEVEEYLYSAMEDGFIPLHIESGPSARSVKLPLEKFTLAGATTREGLLSDPFRERFGLVLRLEFYSQEEIEQILRRSARILRVALGEDAVEVLAKRSRGIPRIANRFVRRVRDLAQVRRAATVDARLATEALEMLGVGEHGLEEIDRRLLRTLVEAGKPVGIKTLAAALGEEEQTIEEVYEPFLIRENLLIRTPRGRVATPRAQEILGLRPKDSLF